MYTVDYFIDKFEKIPEENWTSGTYGAKDKHCAFGHCGMRNDSDGFSGKEAGSLNHILHANVVEINDGQDKRYPQPTPKQRILAALRDIKKMNSGQEVQGSDTTKMPKEHDDGKTIHVYHTVKVSATIFDQAKEMILQ